MHKTEEQHLSYWTARQMDWKSSYLDTWTHPHRQMIVDALGEFEPDSVLEVGCASGPNLFRIHRDFPNVKLSGADVNAEAIGVASKFLPGDFRVGTVQQVAFPEKCADVVLTDMVMIYVSRIDETLERIRKLARKHVVLCEFHSENSLERAALRLATGYRAYDYRALLSRHGWRDITITKIPREKWPEGKPQRRYGYVITGNVP